jgi:hypothetical protein
VRPEIARLQTSDDASWACNRERRDQGLHQSCRRCGD